MEFMPYTQYTREDMHNATLNNVMSVHDGLMYMFYPFDIQDFYESHPGVSPVEYITKTMNAAGFHVHAWQGVSGGFDFWVERMYVKNRWNDWIVNKNYAQTEQPLFEGDVK